MLHFPIGKHSGVLCLADLGGVLYERCIYAADYKLQQAVHAQKYSQAAQGMAACGTRMVLDST